MADSDLLLMVEMNLIASFLGREERAASKRVQKEAFPVWLLKAVRRPDLMTAARSLICHPLMWG